MTSRPDALGPIHLDLLREVGNIGSGHAATALSRLLNGRVDIHVPQALVVPLNAAVGVLGDAEVEMISVLQVLSGDLDGHFHYFFDIEQAKQLVERMLRRPMETFGDLEVSVLGEVANILTGSYLAALAAMTGFRIDATPPMDARDMASALLDGSLALLAETVDHVLLINTEFVVDGSAMSVHLLYLPSRGALDRLFGAFGLKS